MKSYLSAAVLVLLGTNVEASQSGNSLALKKALLAKVQTLEHDLKDIDTYLQSELSGPAQ
jgi:hypothetical protein